MIEWRSADVPPAERFDWWCGLIGRHMMPLRISSEHEDDYRASLKVLSLGQATVSAPRYPDLHTVRTARLIRQGDPDQWWMTLTCSGSMSIEQGGRRADLAAGDLMLMDTSQPYDSRVHCRDAGLAGIISLQVPRAALPVPEQKLRRHVARPLPSARGSGALLAQFLRGLVREGRALGDAESDALGRAAIELTAAFLAEQADVTRLLPEETRRQTLARQIKAYVREHLGDGTLSPARIAAAHNISVRYLHNVFEDERQTVSEYVRTQRLERCRADLADPRLGRRGVAEIARRWGMPDAAAFSRAFRRAYGMPPGEYRRHLDRAR
ncbi:helix-turn-helix domain-containing protein [Nonomuraea salmonea]|uniref:Helix-turn-helix domain-containing protein n=1 Tax=Nonomuraea salmonea TaxID=46181 RepID=A0ABV5NV50_9ACTN